MADQGSDPNWLITARKLSGWLEKHPREHRRAARIYQSWGADAARGFLSKVTRVDLRPLRRGDLRFLLGVQPDYDGYARAVEVHRMAWSAAGWNARAPFTSPGGEYGTSKRGKGGGKNGITRAAARAAKERT